MLYCPYIYSVFFFCNGHNMFSMFCYCNIHTCTCPVGIQSTFKTIAFVFFTCVHVS